MENKLCLMVCEYFEREVAAILESERFDDVVVVTFPANCDNPQIRSDALAKTIHACKGGYDQIHIFCSLCITRLESITRELEHCHIHKLNQCFSLFASRNIIDKYCKEGAHLLTPGWLKHWRRHIEECGFNQQTAQKFFRESTTKLLLLDTGVDRKSPKYLQEFADFIGLPFETVPVGLDFFRLFLTKIILEWRLKSERTSSDAALSHAKQQVADYAMMCDLLNGLTRMRSETEIIETIFGVFIKLYAASSIIYVPLIDGKPGSIQSHPKPLTDSEAAKSRLLSLPKDKDYAWTESGGFFLRIHYYNETLGILEVTGFVLPEHRERYMNLAPILVKGCGLAISHARTYQLLQKDIAERKRVEEILRTLNGSLEQCVLERTALLAKANKKLQGEITKHKRVAEALRKSEERLTEAQQIAHIGNWEWDVVKNEAYWSDETYRIFGLVPQEFVITYEAFLSCVHPDDRELVKKSVDDALYEKKPYDFEHRILLKDATVRIVHEKGVVAFDDTGRAIRIAGTAQDITERKQVEKEIHLLQTIILGISMSETVCSALVFAMKEVCTFTGWVYGEGWKPNANGACLERDHTYYSRVDGLDKFSVFSQGCAFPIGIGLPGRAWAAKRPVWVSDITRDFHYLRTQVAREVGLKTGIAFPVIANNEVVAVMVFYKFEAEKEDERLVKLVSTVMTQLGPIVKRKQMEETQLRLVAILETTPDFVGIANKKGQVFYINRAGRKMIGIGEDENISETIISQYHPEWASKIVINDGIPTALRDGIWSSETALLNRDGREIPVSQIIISHKLPNGEVEFVSTIMRDLTEQKRVDAEKTKLREQLYHAQRLESVGRLAGGIAHEFNNALTAIIGYASLMQMETKKDAPLGNYAQKILTSAERAADLTQRILALSSKQINDPKLISLNTLIKVNKGLLLKLIGEDIALKTAFTGKDCTVIADSNQIAQVLMNLIANARDAMPDGGFLAISTDVVELDNNFIKAHGYGEAGTYALLSVSDTGIGIDEKTKEKIFEPFFTTKEFGKGSGLGLAIAYGIVKQHQGYIDVLSEPGKGTTFQIYLPVIESKGIKSEIQAASTGGTLLVAEDEEEVRKLTKLLLEKAGYTVIEAVNGEDAINKFMQNQDTIQLLVFDVKMPKKSGKEAYSAIKKIRPDMKVLFISGYSHDIIHKTDILAEGLTIISKPVLPQELLRKIREALEK